jgi:exodeoxyribonuclease V
MSEIILNTEQQRAYDLILDFIRSRLPLLTIGGYAGTGKTTLIGRVVNELRKDSRKIAFCCFTGKAAMVLKSKISGFIGPDDYCGTIHGLIYRLIEKRGSKLIWERVEFLDYDLIVLDEASMVDGQIFDDLQRYGVPILAVGDHGQLPPVSGRFNLMEHPQYKLEKIVRQAEGNPIIRIASMARETGHIPFGVYGPGIEKVRGMKSLGSMDPDIILCAMNKTRNNINTFIRSRRGFDDMCPMNGESVICLKNNRDVGIFNGNMGVLTSIRPGPTFHDIAVDMGDFEYSGMVLAKQFGSKYLIDNFMADSFDWAYCITVHKSQGSEFRSVVLIEERMGMMNDEDWRRWLYTGVTRAKERLTVLTHE